MRSESDKFDGDEDRERMCEREGEGKRQGGKAIGTGSWGGFIERNQHPVLTRLCTAAATAAATPGDRDKKTLAD